MSGFSPVACIEFSGYEETVPQAMAAAEGAAVFAEGRPVMLKPNLVNDSPFPVTTPPALCEAVIAFVRRHTDAAIVIAEGCGDAHLDTVAVFRRLGYDDLSHRLGVALMDLNTADLVKQTRKDCTVFPEMWLPRCLFDHVLVSLPVLKAHTFSQITGSMKNVMGAAPPAHYSGRGGAWKKAVFHEKMHASIRDLNRYRSPDFTVMDATVGLAEFHLGGPCCPPPGQPDPGGKRRLRRGSESRITARNGLAQNSSSR